MADKNDSNSATMARLLRTVPVVNKKHPDHEKPRLRAHSDLVMGADGLKMTEAEKAVLDLVAACGRLADHLAKDESLVAVSIKDRAIDLAFIVLDELPLGRLDPGVMDDWLRDKAALAGVRLTD